MALVCQSVASALSPTPPLKCDINPLTLPEHPCYYPHRSNTNLTISRRNQKTQGSPPGPPEDSTSKPIPTTLTRGPRLKRKSPSPLTGSRAHFPDPQAMESPQTMLGRPRPTTPLPIQRPPSSGAFTPAHCAPVFPVGQPTPGLARPSCLVCPAVPAIRLPGGCTGTPVMKVRLRRHLPRQRSGQAPLPVGSAPHNPDHSRQRVGISQPGADGSAATSGLDSSHRAFHRLPPPPTKQPTPETPQLKKTQRVASLRTSTPD